MTDDLVGRLRSYADTCTGLEPRRIIAEAADHIAGTGKLVARIEALEGENRKLREALANVQYEADREHGGLVHLKRPPASPPEQPQPRRPVIQTDAEVVAIAAGLTAAQEYALLRLPGGDWMTCAETGVSGMAATLLCTRSPALAERRWTRWGSEPGQKRGEGYEYRCLPLGLRVAQHLKQENAK